MVNCVTTDVKFTSYATFAIAAYAIHMYYCLSFYHSFHFTSVFIIQRSLYLFYGGALFNWNIGALFN